MRTSPRFAPSAAELERLIARFPLAQLVSNGPDGLLATPLPLLLQRDEDGTSWLLGHFARANPQVAALRDAPEALAIFVGPHGYISPSWLHDRTQAPTWNFATAHLRLRLRFDDSIAAARHAVETLTASMERGRDGSWSPAELGARYENMLSAIVAFRADVLSIEAKFKLGQNERSDVLADILAAIDDNAPESLAAWMRAANERTPQDKD